MTMKNENNTTNTTNKQMDLSNLRDLSKLIDFQSDEFADVKSLVNSVLSPGLGGLRKELSVLKERLIRRVTIVRNANRIYESLKNIYPKYKDDEFESKLTELFNTQLGLDLGLDFTNNDDSTTMELVDAYFSCEFGIEEYAVLNDDSYSVKHALLFIDVSMFTRIKEQLDGINCIVGYFYDYVRNVYNDIVEASEHPFY